MISCDRCVVVVVIFHYVLDVLIRLPSLVAFKIESRCLFCFRGKYKEEEADANRKAHELFSGKDAALITDVS